MKTMLRAALVMLLCVVLFLCLAPGGYAGDDLTQTTPAEAGSGLTSVRFYNEKDYDLVGLSVQDAGGKEMEPVSTKDGWVYLLAPGTYSYRYHDDRVIFDDLEETVFIVGKDELEIRITLTAVFADNFVTVTDINPIYEDILDESDLVSPDFTEEEMLDSIVRELIDEAENGSRRRASLRSASDLDNAASTIRSGMIDRQQTITIIVYSSSKWTQAEVKSFGAQARTAAFSHTGNSNEGDTLRFEYGGSTCNFNYNAGTTGNYRHTFTYTFTYYTTAEQEQAAAAKVDELVMSLGLNAKSDYEKILTIHEYLYSHVVYDNAHVNDSTYLLQFSGYAALVQNCAVCQGYSVAFYRLCLASGVEARVVGSDTMNHAWNIVQLGGQYYELDATWDASRYRSGSTDMPYFFLRGSSWWLANHKHNGISVIGDQFDSSSSKYDPSFDSYMLSANDYHYFVSYNANGGSGAPERQIKLHGQPLTLSETQPARASVSAGSYTVTLNANGGSVSQSTLSAARTTSYTFNNWNTAAGGGGTSYASGGTYTADAPATLYAQWNSSTTTASVTLPTPTLDGYTFKGWAASSSAAGGITGSYTPTEDVTLYATWQVNTYTVSYDANGGSGAPEQQAKTHGVSLELSAVEPSRDSVSDGSCTVTLDANDGTDSSTSMTAALTTSYTFNDWNTAQNGGGASYASGGMYTADAPVTLYAQWSSSTTTASVTLPTPTRDDYVFNGWGTSSSAASGFTGSYTPTGDVTLYAVWLKPDLVLPSALTEIDEEAFSGAAFSFVKLSENTVSIGKNAFAECPYLGYIEIPCVNVEIDALAFGGRTELTVFGKAGGSVESFAEDRGFTFVALG